MKKSILNIGKALNKAEQKRINGGIGNCDLPNPELGQTHLCSGGGPVIINPITCDYWCQ